MKPRIIIETPMALLSKEQQEQIWTLSRTNDVFEKDINGELWQVVDLTNGNEVSNHMLARASNETDIIGDAIKELKSATLEQVKEMMAKKTKYQK